MSFSSDVKTELAEHTGKARHCRLAELAAFVYFGCKLEGGDVAPSLTIGTDSASALQKYFTLLKKTISIDEYDGYSAIESVNTISGDVLVQLFEVLRAGNDLIFVDEIFLQQTCCKRAFIRGAFIVAGSMSDPEKGYHFEIVCRSEILANQLQSVINSFDINAKVVERKGKFVVYLKEASEIVEVLSVMEASVSLMNLENIRILKEMRNSVNRKVNCEAANITKTVNAAVRQIEDIKFIEDKIGIDSLPVNLQEIARLRLENEDSSLIDLGQMLESPVGKSGVNHRLRRISEIANSLRES